jgi:hypothetical protein
MVRNAAGIGQHSAAARQIGEPPNLFDLPRQEGHLER